MQVQAVLSAPGELTRKLSKQNLRRKDVQVMGVLWETADYICMDPMCGYVHDGYGNYVTNLEKQLNTLEAEIKILKERT